MFCGHFNSFVCFGLVTTNDHKYTAEQLHTQNDDEGRRAGGRGGTIWVRAKLCCWTAADSVRFGG